MDQLNATTPTETFRVPQDVTYNWNYDNTRAQLVRLYDHAKRDQWDAATLFDWSQDVDPRSELVPDASIGIWADANTKSASRLDPKRSGLASSSRKPTSSCYPAQAARRFGSPTS